MPQRNYPEITSGDWRYVALMAAGFLALGVWQHLYFSYSVGQLTFFKNGFDEDTYLLYPFGIAGIRPDRLLSGAVVSGIVSLLPEPRGVALAVLDTLFFPLVILAAYSVGAAIFKDIKARCLFAIILALAPDLFSLGNAAAYPGPFPTIEQFRALLGKALVPPIETSYLNLYRSPEPQVSYTIVFCQIALLLRFIFSEARSATLRTILGLIVFQLLATGCYLIIAYPLFAFEGVAAILLLLSGYPRKAAILGLLLIVSTLGTYAILVALGDPTPGFSLFFQSRIPEITVGVLSAAVVTLLSAIMLLQRRSDTRLIAAFAFAIIPLALMNQQVVTGWMISGKDWERYINLPMVVISGGLLFSFANYRRKWQSPATVAAIFVVAGFSILFSKRTYDLWLADNLKATAIARAIDAAGPLGRDRLLVFEQPEYVPHVATRTRRPYQALLDFTEVFKTLIPATPEFRSTPLSESLFEYWRQTNVSPAAAQEILQRETLQQGGYYSGFIFNMCEYWSPCSDGRNLQTEKVLRNLPIVISSYERFLTARAENRKFAHVTSKSSAPLAGFTKIGEGRAGSIIARVWIRDQ
jgi:hypothetical protein